MFYIDISSGVLSASFLHDASKLNYILTSPPHVPCSFVSIRCSGFRMTNLEMNSDSAVVIQKKK